ncbi:hypothetical protein TrLO_g10366 [Triparma laevis f. longispina]|nr:hypothetical protein TrLO_g10366 [Triparma laevis f. longispina]
MLKEQAASLKARDDELKEKDAALKVHEAYRANADAARKKSSLVIDDLNQEKEDLKKKLKKTGAANADTFADSSLAVNGKHGPNHSMIYDRTTKTIRLEIHEDPDKVLESIIEDRAAARDKLDQQVLKEKTDDNETIVHWTIEEQNKSTSTSLLLKLKVERATAAEIRIAVASIEEEDLDTTCLQVPPLATAKSFRLLLNGGSITLKPLPLGRTSFNLTAQADLREEENFDDDDDDNENETFSGRKKRKTMGSTIKLASKKVRRSEE